MKNKKDFIMIAGIIIYIFIEFWITENHLHKSPAHISLARTPVAFDCNILLSSLKPGLINTYERRKVDVTLQEALYYGGLFSMKDPPIEEVDRFLFTNGFESVSIMKHEKLVIYESHKPKMTGVIKAEDAKNIAVDFIKKRMLSLHYNDAEVVFSAENNYFTVTFINTLNGIPNFAYPKTAVVGIDGQILSLHYYGCQYEKLVETTAISSLEAYDKMVADHYLYSSNITIDIKKYTLIYYPISDTIRPCYRFSGETDQGERFVCIVPAESAQKALYP